MSELRIEKTIFINAAPQTVWLYLTDKAKLGDWFHKTNVDLETDADYELLNAEGTKICWGRVLEAKAPSRLIYTFTHNWLKEHETTVVWNLTPVFDGTMLKLTHDGFEGAENVFDLLLSHDKGWDDHFVKLRDKAVD